MAQQETTMDRINLLASERSRLYRTSGAMSENDRLRVQRISQELERLWDQLRRERAARRWGPQRRMERDLFKRVA